MSCQLERNENENENGNWTIPCNAKLLPRHILPPLPNGHHSLRISCFFPDSGSTHRWGSHSVGCGYTSSILWSVYADDDTVIPPGILSYPFIDVPLGISGVTRGSGDEAGACKRSVSRIIASRSGRESMSDACGRARRSPSSSSSSSSATDVNG